MKRLVQWIQIPELFPLPVMDRVFEECTAAFKDDGCIVKRVTSWEELEDGGLLFLDDAAGRYLELRSQHDRIANQCPNSIMIAWYWMDPSYRPFSRMIVTGELYVYRERTSHEKRSFMLRPDFVPLMLRANESPELIGTHQRTDTMDYCFMGGGYKQDWVPPSPEFTGVYHQVIYNNYLSYDERRSIYLSSRFSLAFQSDENIQTGHLSQRIFEGLAYGCIVFCENPLASQFTDGAVIHVTSREDLWAKMREWKSQPDRMRDQQKKGYEWSKRYGTNRTSMALLWSRIQSRFHVQWNVSQKVIGAHLMGGLGNQMFQLAAGFAYAYENGAQLKIEKREENGHRTFYWDNLLSSFSLFLCPSFTNLNLTLWQDGFATVYRPLPQVNSLDNGVLLNGYFQSGKYFKKYGVRNKLRYLFRAPYDLEHGVYHSYPYLIRNSHRVVVLHCRRTDYLIHRDFHGPLDGEYYRQALDRILPHISEPIFLLTGDDPSFWSEIRNDIPEVFQNPHIILQNETDVRTFILLQQFKYFIMSNSTFIWWVVWMANSNKVIVPKQWFGPKGLSNWEDVYDPEWEQV
jgi:hypothetical protein